MLPSLLQDLIMIPMHAVEGLSVRYGFFRTLYRTIAPVYGRSRASWTSSERTRRRLWPLPEGMVAIRIMIMIMIMVTIVTTNTATPVRRGEALSRNETESPVRQDSWFPLCDHGLWQPDRVGWVLCTHAAAQQQ